MDEDVYNSYEFKQQPLENGLAVSANLSGVTFSSEFALRFIFQGLFLASFFEIIN